eukprot:1875792-Amphidinium_carterae.1
MAANFAGFVGWPSLFIFDVLWVSEKRYHHRCGLQVWQVSSAITCEFYKSCCCGDSHATNGINST